MAHLFKFQAKKYAETRPTYPPELFRFIASKCPRRLLVWDVGTGSGQAAVSLAELFEKVVATDASPEQLANATKLPNIHYHHTASTMNTEELEQVVAPPGTVDLVTVAQALHWFDLPAFYSQVKHVLRRPGGVLAAWCYSEAVVDEGDVDRVFRRYYDELSAPYWDPARRMVDDRYRSLQFPFEAVEGEEGTGPVEFDGVREMDCEGFLAYLRSWSAYQTAKGKGVELLTEEVVDDFRRAWSSNEGEEEVKKKVRFPIHLRIGRVMD